MPLVVAPAAGHDALRIAGARALDLAHLGEAGGTPPPRHGSDAPLYLSYTTGTTGAPKGAILRSGPVTVGTAAIAERLEIGHTDVLLVTTPTPSSFQLVAALMPAIHAGATVGLAAGLSTAAIAGLAATQSATVLVGYPLTLGDILDEPAVQQQSTLRLAVSGGSPLPPAVRREYRDSLGLPLVESYGQSELGGFMALGTPGDPIDGFVGAPLPDRLAYPADSLLRRLPPGKAGEIVVPGGFFDRYLGLPEETAQVLEGGLLHTGDVGMSDPTGRLRVLGRTRERAIARRRGGWVRELEDAFHEHADVRHAVVVDRADRGLEAFVQLRRGHSGPAEPITEAVTEHLPRGLRPVRTHLVEAMPRTFSGKADRASLST